MIKYILRLTEDERAMLRAVVNKGQAAAQKIKPANILLKIDADGPAWSEAQAAEAFGCCLRTILSIRQRFLENGLEAALERKPRTPPPRERILDGEGEAHLVRLAGLTPPEGQARWTLHLLAERLVERNVVETISRQTVMRTLKKTN